MNEFGGLESDPKQEGRIRNIENCITFITAIYVSGSSSVGRASASQAEGREFESRLPLSILPIP